MADKQVMMPTLSEEGWVSTAASIADNLFAHFFVSDYSQTQLYLNQVASFSWILQEGQGDMSKISTLTQETLEKYFGRYFSNVIVEVSTANDTETPNKASVTIYVSFKDKDGKKYVLGKLLSMLNSKVAKIIDINNNSTGA